MPKPRSRCSGRGCLPDAEQPPELFQLALWNVGPLPKLLVDSRGIFVDGLARAREGLHEPARLEVGLALGGTAGHFHRDRHEAAVELDVAADRAANEALPVGERRREGAARARSPPPRPATTRSPRTPPRRRHDA